MQVLLGSLPGDRIPTLADLDAALRRQDWLKYRREMSPRSVATLVVTRGTVWAVRAPSELEPTGGSGTFDYVPFETPRLIPSLQVETSYVSFDWLAPRVAALAQELGLAIETPLVVAGIGSSSWWKPPPLGDDRALGQAIEISRSCRGYDAWALLGFAMAGAECLELAESSPALAALVACSERLGEHRRSQMPVGGLAAAFRELAGRPRHEILGSLGFPRSRSMVRLLARLSPPVHVSDLWNLARGPLPRDAEKVFRHLPRLTSEALAFATSPRLWPHVGARLLRETAMSRHNGAIAFDLEDTLRMAAEVGREHTIGVVQSQADLLRLQSALLELADRRAPIDAPRQCASPPPAAPAGTATIQRLVTPEALRDEGRELQHCVGGYARRLSLGEVAVYRILHPERATLCVSWQRAGGRWKIEQLRGFGNTPVSSATETAVREWLARLAGA